MFGLLFGDHIPEENPYFRLIRTLNKILEIVMSPQLAFGHYVTTEVLVNDVYNDFNQLFLYLQPINK